MENYKTWRELYNEALPCTHPLASSYQLLALTMINSVLFQLFLHAAPYSSMGYFKENLRHNILAQ